MKKSNFLTILLALLCAVTYAQPNLINPNGYADTYPAPIPNSSMVANSCYSMTNVVFNNTYCDFYVSGWSPSGSTGKIVWRIMPQNTYPPVAVNQGDIPINGSDIEVGILSFNGDNYIVTAYFKNGVGYVFERYIWNGSAFVLFSTQTLSTTPGKKINMDMYGSSEMAVVWYETIPPTSTTIIKCILARDLATTQIITLAGTENCIFPDVALSKNSQGATPMDIMAAHFVYTKVTYLPAPTYGYNAEITESTIPFMQVFITNPAVYPPFIEDVNTIGQTQVLPQASIDCPDVCMFNPFANWAYVYQSDNGIEMRVINQNLGVPPTTKNLVNGSDYGNYNIYFPNANFSPTIAYDNTGQSIHVGWRHYIPLYSALVALEITEDGNSLVSPMDYQMISTNSTAAYPQFSKNTRYSPYLYTTFTENYNTPRHLFHMWGDPAFKGQPTGIANSHLQEKIGIAPNPFIHAVHFIVPGSLINEDITITMTDVIGRTLYSGTCKGNQLEATLQPGLDRLCAGTYILAITSPALHYSQKQKLVKGN